jgi:hypothetical protein
MKRLLAAAVLASALQMIGAGLASAQVVYMGEVRLFGFNFCPKYWLQASGQILSINQYVPLFSLYGTLYGGDGEATFALPNLNGRAPYGWSISEPSPGTVYGSSTAAPLRSLDRFGKTTSRAPSPRRFSTTFQRHPCGRPPEPGCGRVRPVAPA